MVKYTFHVFPPICIASLSALELHILLSSIWPLNLGGSWEEIVEYVRISPFYLWSVGTSTWHTLCYPKY